MCGQNSEDLVFVDSFNVIFVICIVGFSYFGLFIEYFFYSFFLFINMFYKYVSVAASCNVLMLNHIKVS